MATNKKIAGATAKEIEKIHRDLARQLQGCIEFPIEISPMPEFRDGWHKRSFHHDVSFDMWSKAATIGQLWGERTGGRARCPVSLLKPLTDKPISACPWVAWRDEWIRVEEDDFILKSASFTFFDGRPTQVGEQMFRAEWAQKGHGGEKSAQPHWHIDWPLPIMEGDGSLSGIHLAMAGWHPDSQSPECWQREVGKEWKILVDWATLTLVYSRDQLFRFYYD